MPHISAAALMPHNRQCIENHDVLNVISHEFYVQSPQSWRDYNIFTDNVNCQLPDMYNIYLHLYLL